MHEITETVLSLWKTGRKTTQTAGGWISGNAVCCHHRGEGRDTRRRGGLMLTTTGGFSFHCFNCNFKAGWTPTHLISNNTRSLFKWLGLPEIDIQRLNLLALKLKDDQPNQKKKQILSFTLEERSLPDDCLPIDTWIKEGCTDPDLLAVIEYIAEIRRMDWSWYPWHWSPAPGYKDRVIIPFYQDGKLVGYTGRKIKPGKPKYLSDSQSGYVFNFDAQIPDRKYGIVVEGQFDAIAIDGMGIMTNEPNETQCARINTLAKEIIVVPDRDRAGANLIQAAINNDWSISLPPWEDHIKDVADAVKAYGRLYTLYSILYYKETNKIKFELIKRKLQHD
jgi:hypothetical protein